MSTIEVEHLTKEFNVQQKEKGIRGALHALFHPQKSILRAVDDVSFTIPKGEIVGYLGPNGAGKSTTVKLLSGILHPTSGSIRILGMDSVHSRRQVVSQLGVVFGQRSQLYWDLRLGESFELLRRIYQIDDETFEKNMSVMHDVLKIREIINQPVRQLSLGQRMRGDIAAAMLHSPSVLFLDEPTIGLDVEAKDAIRSYIRRINQEFQVTIILTTHDLDDVENLCDRVMVINHGKLIEDGTIDQLITKIAPYRYLIAEFEETPTICAPAGTEILRQEGRNVVFRFHKSKTNTAHLISTLSSEYALRDVRVEETKIEDVIRILYQA